MLDFWSHHFDSKSTTKVDLETAFRNMYMMRAQYNKMRSTIGEKRMLLAEFEGLKMCCIMLPSFLDHACVFSGLQTQKITWLSTEMVGGKTKGSSKFA